MEENDAVHVGGEHHDIGGIQYELSIYKQAERCYGSWLCITCATRNETERLTDEDEVRTAASGEMDLHHAIHHTDRPGHHVVVDSKR